MPPIVNPVPTLLTRRLNIQIEFWIYSWIAWEVHVQRIPKVYVSVRLVECSVNHRENERPNILALFAISLLQAYGFENCGRLICEQYFTSSLTKPNFIYSHLRWWNVFLRNTLFHHFHLNPITISGIGLHARFISWVLQNSPCLTLKMLIKT